MTGKKLADKHSQLYLNPTRYHDKKEHTTNTLPQSRFSAFFLFSAPVAPPLVAALFTAFVGAGVPPPRSIPIPPPVFPPPLTLASAVLSGEGEACRSLLLAAIEPFSPVRLDGDDLRGRGSGGGDTDFRVTMGRVNMGGAAMAEVVGACGGREGIDDMGGTGVLEVVVDDEADDSSSDDGGTVSNSAGLTRGTAWILVINLARSQ
jgi:hypothetical protein